MAGEKGKFPVIGAIVCCVPPLFMIAYGIRVLTKYIPTTAHLIEFILIPIMVWGICMWVLASKRKPRLKLLLCVLIIAVFLLLSFFIVCFSTFGQLDEFSGDAALERWNAMHEEVSLDFIPSRSASRQAEDIRCWYYSLESIVFYTRTCTLLCSYTPSEYESQKAELMAAYDFMEVPLGAESEGSQTWGELYGFDVGVLDTGSYFPKLVYLAGFNDEAAEIVYVTYFDIDLDYIQSIENFLLSHCGWKYMFTR